MVLGYEKKGFLSLKGVQKGLDDPGSLQDTFELVNLAA